MAETSHSDIITEVPAHLRVDAGDPAEAQETPKQEIITEMPAHLRIDVGEIDKTPEADSDTLNLELGERVARAVVVVPDRRPSVRIAEEDVTPQMRANALGSPYRRDELGRIVPR